MFLNSKPMSTDDRDGLLEDFLIFSLFQAQCLANINCTQSVPVG